MSRSHVLEALRIGLAVVTLAILLLTAGVLVAGVALSENPLRTAGGLAVLVTASWIVVSLVSGAVPGARERACRVCGCTDEDCTECYERTGIPCHWVAWDLCSACGPSPLSDPASEPYVEPKSLRPRRRGEDRPS